MDKLINLSIDLTKVPKEVIVTTDKNGQAFSNGAKYLNLTLSVRDGVDQFGNHAAVWLNQSQEQRQAKEPKKYVGNGKTFWSGTSTQGAGETSAANEQSSDKGDLPF